MCLRPAVSLTKSKSRCSLRHALSHSPLSLLALALWSVVAACAGASAQTVDVSQKGYSLTFTPRADSSSCVLSGFHFSVKRPVAVTVPEFVMPGSHKLMVRVVGDGETGPFEGAEGVWRISLPQSVTDVFSFGTCHSLTSVTVAAPAPPALSKALLGKWRHDVVADTLRVPASAVEAYRESAWGKAFNEIFPLYTFTYDRTRPDGVVQASVETPVNLSDLFFAYSDGGSGLSTRTPVVIAKSLRFPAISLYSADFKTMSSRLAAWPSAEALAAKFRGNSVANLAARLNGLFGTLRAGASVSNLVLDDAFLLVDPEAETFERSDDGRTLYVHVIAGRNHGSLSAVGFAGSVAMEKGAAPSGVEKVVVSLVGRQGRTGSVNGFLFLENPATQHRSVTYLTDCQGVGFDESLASKVAIRKTDSAADSKTSAPFKPEDERYRYTSCAFSDEEFASGLVAYWLNFRGVGFSGEYKPLWRQGLRHPEAETNPAKALYKVDYQIDGESFLTSAPVFANGGDRVTISYSRKPVTLTVGGKTVQPGDESATFSYAADDVVAISWTRADFKPAEKVREPGIEFDIKGSLITIRGAGKQVKGLYTVTGIKICETTGATLSAPKRGAYSVKIGKRSWRVFVK